MIYLRMSWLLLLWLTSFLLILLTGVMSRPHIREFFSEFDRHLHKNSTTISIKGVVILPPRRSKAMNPAGFMNLPASL